jgi:ERCC4-related helicase
LRQQIERVEEEYAEDDSYEAATGDAVDASTRLFHVPTPAEQSLLDKMSGWAETAAFQPDSKTLALLDWLRRELKPGGQWNDERVIIFTEYRATQNWLQTLLAAEGFSSGGRLETLYGGMDSELREQVKAASTGTGSSTPHRFTILWGRVTSSGSATAACCRATWRPIWNF